MIFATPSRSQELSARLAELDGLRTRLAHEVGSPSSWLGTLRRLARASSVESSVSIEGYAVPDGEALAIVSRPDVAPLDDENRLAVACYARAMDHVGVLASDPDFEWLGRVILDLHFDACHYQTDKSPGRWRTGPIYVTGRDGAADYQGPPAGDVVGLMSEVVEWLRDGDLDSHVVVRGAMAHLHTVSVHPFRDGNGRISRIVQSLVLTREGHLTSEFASIEEYLASHTLEYYAVLRDVQGGRYTPERDASAWVNFCVEAHIAQARKRLDQIAAAAARWNVLEELVESRGWPDRLVIALEQILIGGTYRSQYQLEADVSLATASNDFRRLLDAGFTVQVGRGRSTRYSPSDDLRARTDKRLGATTGGEKPPD